MKRKLSACLGLSVALTLFHVGPICADAAVTERILALTLRIEQSPNDQALLLQRSLAYLENNQAELALADIRLAEAVGDPAEAAYTHGVLLYRIGDYTAARPYFDRCLLAYPGHRGALDYRARLLRDSGESRQALADYEALIALDDSLDPGYYVAAARLMATLPDRGVDEALALLDARMAQRGPLTALQRYAIELEKNRGNYPGAIGRMAGLDQRLRATPHWQVETAQLLLLAGQQNDALAYLAVAQEQLRAGRLTAAQRELLETVEHLQERARKPPGELNGHLPEHTANN